MSTIKIEKEERAPEDTQEDLKDQDQEQEPEEEPVDIELQKQMQKVTIDDSVFDQHQAKQKEKGQKKATKKKGQDFLDYANKNNIQINLQFGEEEKHYDYQHKKKPNDYTGGQYQYQHQPQAEPQSQQQQQQQPQLPPGMNPKGKYKGNNKFKGNAYKTNQQGRKVPVKFGENKFDACNSNVMPYQYGNPHQQPQPYYQQHQYGQQHPQPQYQQYNQPQCGPQNKEMTLTTDDQILGYIERLLSLNTLNKDLYLRFRLSDTGLININELANYYGLKNNNVTPQKIIDVISKNDTVASVGVVEENDSIYISIKHWSAIAPQLISIEAISAKKKQLKAQQQAQMSMPSSQYTPYTYIHMQNNYYIPNQGGVNEMQGYHNDIPSQHEMNQP